MTRTGFRKLYFSPFSLYNILHMTSRTTKDDAHGNESVTTQLGSESASALCTKKVSPLLSCIAGSSKKPLLIMEASLKIILTLTKEAIVLICDSTCT